MKIAGRESEHFVDARKEELIRKAVAKINKEYDALRYDFRNQDPGDVLRLILVSEEMRLMELEERSSTEKSSVIRRLEELDAGLDEYLSR